MFFTMVRGRNGSRTRPLTRAFTGRGGGCGRCWRDCRCRRPPTGACPRARRQQLVPPKRADQRGPSVRSRLRPQRTLLGPVHPRPARAPKPSTPASGRPLGSKNRRPATRYDVGKNMKRPESTTERNRLRP
ncbi:hypothetical protein GTY84_30990 [Streptomyces sp. SID8352]|nr:hypothetical protein [Streptomyces sp. SID8352]